MSALLLALAIFVINTATVLAALWWQERRRRDDWVLLHVGNGDDGTRGN